MESSFSGKRRTAREMAVQMLYQSDVGGSRLPQIFSTFDINTYLVPELADEEGPRRTYGSEDPDRRPKQLREAFEYARRLVTGTVDNLERIDALIRRQADNWRLERMPVVDRNVLRLAVYEMLFEEDIPKLVVVDEAIELAKRFGSDQSGRFINGLLDGLLKSRSFPGRMT